MTELPPSDKTVGYTAEGLSKYVEIVRADIKTVKIEESPESGSAAVLA
jgi:hypothetical protein